MSDNNSPVARSRSMSRIALSSSSSSPSHPPFAAAAQATLRTKGHAEYRWGVLLKKILKVFSKKKLNFNRGRVSLKVQKLELVCASQYLTAYAYTALDSVAVGAPAAVYSHFLRDYCRNFTKKFTSTFLLTLFFLLCVAGPPRSGTSRPCPSRASSAAGRPPPLSSSSSLRWWPPRSPTRSRSRWT